MKYDGELKAYGDARISGGLPNADATLEVKSGPKLTVSASVNSDEAAKYIDNQVDKLNEGLRAGAVLSRWVPWLRFFFGTRGYYARDRAGQPPF